MSLPFDRRVLLLGTPAFFLAPTFDVGQEVRPTPPAGPFPRQEPELVHEIVSASHGNAARVKELLSARPALARASWDWGFGDHESAIDAASHVGNRPIADILIANGARPTIFTSAMLGQVQVVKGMVEALPGVQRTRGPHGITLLAHAKAGGAAAREVVTYLERLGDADPRYSNLPLTDAQRTALVGDYGFGPGPAERLRVVLNTRGDITILRPGVMTERMLFHHGDLVFNPSGAEAVRIRFEVAAGAVTALAVEDGDVRVTAHRIPNP